MQRVCIILPSRGRWESLKTALASIVAGEDAGVEVIVGLDADDPTIGPLSEVEQFPGVRASVHPRAPSVGALFNLLYAESTADYFIPFPDDYTITTVDWAKRLRDAVMFMPAGLGVAYLADQLYRGFSTFPVISRETIELNGFFMPPFFPFLFGDTWWNEVGNLCGVKQPIDAHVQIGLVEGNKHALRDMVFWATLFERTRPMREQTAVKILNRIYEGHETEAAWLISTIPNRSEICRAFQSHMFHDPFLAQWDNTDASPPSERYLALKDKAAAFLEQYPNPEEKEIVQ